MIIDQSPQSRAPNIVLIRCIQRQTVEFSTCWHWMHLIITISHVPFCGACLSFCANLWQNCGKFSNQLNCHPGAPRGTPTQPSSSCRRCLSAPAARRTSTHSPLAPRVWCHLHSSVTVIIHSVTMAPYLKMSQLNSICGPIILSQIATKSHLLHYMLS